MSWSLALREVRLGVKTLLLHKLRSALTMLGVVFGVGSVVAMLSVGEGASRDALERIQRLGSNNIILTSIKPPDDAGAASRTFVSVYGLKYEDQQRIDQLPGVLRTVPARIVRKEGRLGELALQMRVVATTPAWFDLVPRQVLAGRTLVDHDNATVSAVAVLTESGARRLLATQTSLGEVITLGTSAFRVVGIIQTAGGITSGIATPDQDVDVYIPLSTGLSRFGEIDIQRAAGGRSRELVELHQVLVQARDLASVEATAAAIEALLTRFRRTNDVRMDVPLALLREAENTQRTFNIVLGSIAAISLLVGGIGIMNIMLASVTERTREIGIRRAIGARQFQIIVQFLIETTVLSTLGGLVGVAVGFLIPWLITTFAGMPTIITFWSVALSLGISVGVGIVFGLYPAVRAASLDPIVALRRD